MARVASDLLGRCPLHESRTAVKLVDRTSREAELAREPSVLDGVYATTAHHPAAVMNREHTHRRIPGLFRVIARKFLFLCCAAIGVGGYGTSQVHSRPVASAKDYVLDVNADGIADFIVPGPRVRMADQLLTTIEIRSSRSSDAIAIIAVNDRGPATLDKSWSCVGDTDNDGRVDLAVATKTETVVYSGGTTVLSKIPARGVTHAVVGGCDFNVDGSSEIVLVETGEKSTGPTPFRIQIISPTKPEIASSISGEPYGDSLYGVEVISGSGAQEALLLVATAGSESTHSNGSCHLITAATGRRLYSVTGPDSKEAFGTSISSLGDVDGDNYSDFLVGAPGSEILQSSGSVYVLSGRTGAVANRVLGSSLGTPIDRPFSFGLSVARLGDLNGDGILDFSVGAPASHRGGKGGVGFVTFHSGRDGSCIRTVHGVESGSMLGINVRGVGDANGDRIPDAYMRSRLGFSVISGLDGLVIFQRDFVAAR